jgi:hypothetical protein
MKSKLNLPIAIGAVIVYIVGFYFVLSVFGSKESVSVKHTIEKNACLIDYLGDYQTSIDVAEQFGFLVYIVVCDKKQYITYSKARELECCTDYVRVVVKVKPGWVLEMNDNVPVCLQLPERNKTMTPEQLCKELNQEHYEKYYTLIDEAKIKAAKTKKIVWICIGIVVACLLLGLFYLLKKQAKKDADDNEGNSKVINIDI